MLIFLGFQQRGLIRIREKSAFRHDHRMLAEPAEEQLFAAALDLAVILRLKHRVKLLLHRLRERFASAVGRGIEHLRTAVFRIRELILVDRDADSVLRRIEDRKAVIHIGGLLIGDPLNALIVDRAVGVPRNLHLIAGDHQQITQIEQDIEVDPLFRYAVRR